MLFWLFVFMAILTVPSITFADSGSCSLTSPFDGPIVPCGRQGQSSCTLCHLLELLQNIFCFLYGLLITVSLAMITVAGVLYIVSAGASLKAMAKTIIVKTLTGFAIFLLAWLIVFSVLKLSSSNNMGEWWQMTCDEESAFDWASPDGVRDTHPAATNTKANNTKTTDHPDWTQKKENENTKKLADKGLYLNSTDPNRTSTGLLEDDTMDDTIAFKDEFNKQYPGENLIVSGAAEQGGHSKGSKHYSGKAIDIRSTGNDNVSKFIENNYTKTTSAFGGYDTYVDSRGNTYVNETGGKQSHWHIVHN